MYKVASPYETRFAFSRFDDPEQLSPAVDGDGLARAGDASATEVADPSEELA